MRTGTVWPLRCTGSAAIFRGGADGRPLWAFVNLADRSPLFQQLRSRLKSRAPVSCTGSSWTTGMRARTFRSLGNKCKQQCDHGVEVLTVVRDARRRARCVPDRPVNLGNSRSLPDSLTHRLTCVRAGRPAAQTGLLSSGSTASAHAVCSHRRFSDAAGRYRRWPQDVQGQRRLLAGNTGSAVQLG
jgi:hypothetical protein